MSLKTFSGKLPICMALLGNFLLFDLAERGDDLVERGGDLVERVEFTRDSLLSS